MWITISLILDNGIIKFMEVIPHGTIRQNVTVILEFLVAENFSASVISLHRLCYKALRKHLTEEKYFILRTPHINGLMTNKTSWNYRQHTGWKHCVDQLEDVYNNGLISPNNLGARGFAYCLLSETLKAELDDFLNNGLVNPWWWSLPYLMCKVLLYLQNKRCQSISQLDYSVLCWVSTRMITINLHLQRCLWKFDTGVLRYSSDQGRCFGFRLPLTNC